MKISVVEGEIEMDAVNPGRVSIMQREHDEVSVISVLLNSEGRYSVQEVDMTFAAVQVLHRALDNFLKKTRS